MKGVSATGRPSVFRRDAILCLLGDAEMADDQNSAVIDLQRQAMDPGTPVSHLLRVAKVMAVKLNLADALVWIDAELDGYMEKSFEDLPAYRRLSGEWVGLSPYSGWQTIHFDTPDFAEWATRAPIGLSIAALENELGDRKSGGKGAVSFLGQQELRSKFVREFRLREARLEVPQAQVWAIVDRVRSLVLDWTLELEKAGVLGHGLQFTPKEKVAASVTKNYFIQNAGVVGDVSGGNVQNSQTATANINVDMLTDIVAQVRPLLDRLPKATADELAPVLDEIENPSTPPSRMASLAASAKRILEGASGNIVAEGFIGLLGKLLT
jgi:hypothetical protein